MATQVTFHQLITKSELLSVRQEHTAEHETVIQPASEAAS